MEQKARRQGPYASEAIRSRANNAGHSQKVPSAPENGQLAAKAVLSRCGQRQAAPSILRCIKVFKSLAFMNTWVAWFPDEGMPRYVSSSWEETFAEAIRLMHKTKEDTRWNF